MKLIAPCLLLVLIAACSNDTVDGGKPQPVVEPSLLTFNSVSIGLTKLLTVTLSNRGGRVLRVENVVIDGAQASAFVVATATKFDIGAGDSDRIQIEFTPR